MKINDKENKKENGQGLVEYALVLVLVAVVVILILSVLGSRVTLVYAQVLAGFNGDSLDDNAIMIKSDVSITGTSVCTATIENAQFIVTDANGDVLTGQSVTAEFLANGDPTGVTITADANNSGIATFSGSKTVSGGCPLTVTLSN